MASLNECMDMEKANAEHGIVYMFTLQVSAVYNGISKSDGQYWQIDKLWHGIEVENSLIRNLWCKRRKTDAQ